MKRHLLAILIMMPLLGKSQTVQLPSWVVDSLIYNATQAKYYDTLVSKLDNQLAKQGAELLQTNKTLAMQSRQLSTADSLIAGLKKEVVLVQERGDIRLKEESKKKRPWIVAAVIGWAIVIKSLTD